MQTHSPKARGWACKTCTGVAHSENTVTNPTVVAPIAPNLIFLGTTVSNMSLFDQVFTESKTENPKKIPLGGVECSPVTDCVWPLTDDQIGDSLGYIKEKDRPTPKNRLEAMSSEYRLEWLQAERAELDAMEEREVKRRSG